ncbi:hypothetical protein [Engelhardtia mirabilis]|uniref:Uncharacterized protein n=1 Tax=Engelhardtia mirabilis TaxID=2528011 RepID=A0A518BHM2_9BACT|nr:hypothetical protein Pla133_15280 [Planctomycetes bacterium Pla133]QDV00780.1 hypothetical protein Pla86_15270 [Planctomycetes bacterium Pla86]
MKLPDLLLASTAAVVLATTASAEASKLYVVAPSGNVYSAPPKSGVFTLEASSHVPLHSVVQLDGALWLGSPSGEVRRFDLTSHTLSLAFTVANDAKSLAVHGGDLLVAGSNGTVVRVDPDTGLGSTILSAGQSIAALAVDGDTLWAGSPVGEFQRADLALGNGFELAGVTGGPVESMSQTATELYLGSSDGNVWVFDKLSELAVYAYPVDGDATAIVRDGNNFLIGGSNGLIHRVVQVFGSVVETYVAPEPVAALWLEQPLGVIHSDTMYASTVAGAQVDFELGVPLEQAGAFYLLLGSMSGTEPGVGTPSVHLDLNPDVYFNQLINTGGVGLITNAIGVFGSTGAATASLTIPPGAATSLAGMQLHHAFVVLDPFASDLIVGASDPVVLFLF